ncbi:receptor-type tyrosine-protein phosphatase H-like [Clarias gariepinus]
MCCNVNTVNITDRTDSTLTLQWNKVDNNINYNYTLSYNDQNESISGSVNDDVITHTVENLAAGTEYNFSLYTVSEEAQSTGYNFTAVTTPENVANVSVTNRSETELILEWEKVNNNSNYNYLLSYNNQSVTISELGGGSTVTYTVTDLTAGTEYNFTLYTVFKEVLSAGHNFTAVTTPSNVANIYVEYRNETLLILKWEKVNNNSNYNYKLNYNNQNVTISGLGGGSTVTHTVQNLTAGTEYNFILYTVFKEILSAGHKFTAVTTPKNVANVSVTNRSETELIFEWEKVNNNSNYNYLLSYNNQNVTISGLGGGSTVTHTVTDLTAGTEYNFTLYTVFKEILSAGHNFTAVTIPHVVTGLYCQYSSGGYGLTLVWDPPNGGRTAVQVNIKSKSFIETGERLYIDGLMPTQWYTLSVSAHFGPERSIPISITCQTDPRGVIAGVLTFFLLVILILCIGIFIWHYKSRLFSDSKIKSSNEPKLSSNIYKPILLKNFPMHFSTMSRDQNRGFIGEYEDLGTVGTDQSCAAATLPENKSKNRFTNVLAYDSSRVKLASQPGSDTDYINANYIHGYGKEKQYIAAQGPLPSTVNDFWRMVWEQKSSNIVMLTNCTEGGRIKCEQYWPTDDMPWLYGNLRVSVQSEQKESFWTRREFLVRNESASEEHGVTQFHFTAWPDHGVPTGTKDLIQFRWIVRQHIETFPFSGPTVVHCSAGVGRTGTLIALDLLLQQMDKEEEVSVADCVHRMRLGRPLMVQTQSQYVFLHQCIMDSLKPEDNANPEPIYENSDIIYANAVALKEFKEAS